MIKTILVALGLIAIGTICLFVVCSCIISSWVEEREFKDETKYK